MALRSEYVEVFQYNALSLLSKTDGVFHNDPEWNDDQHQTFALSKNAHMGPVCFWGIKSDNIIS